ncbi:hypothetical protein HOLleu_34882 [Holothuria leucospilota]|uniref:Uncharacterized protein n=1 Tax=Holothuria leucospilota TaxID=206669 RepID=A0A9Q0YLZ6_HOLLE|nr:hypothetical protein HOLleu_34882 [Holothuria leucospilota]
MAPDYISNLITKYTPSHCLQSSSESFLSHPPISMTKFYGDRYFAVAARRFGTVCLLMCVL